MIMFSRRYDECGLAPHFCDSTRCLRDAAEGDLWLRRYRANFAVKQGSPRPKRPSLFDALGEFRVPLEASVFWLGALAHPWPHADSRKSKNRFPDSWIYRRRCDARTDGELLPMAGSSRGFAGILSNSECPRETMRKLNARLVLSYEKFSHPIVVMGQSLGGVYAREIARENPEMVERVISLGSPIRLPRKTANLCRRAVARSIALLRGKAEGCLTESCKCGLILSDDSPAEVPTTHVYSRTDGVVHWASCIDHSGAPSVENVEVMGSHVGMGISPDVYRVIADRLAIPLRPRLHLGITTAVAHTNRPAPSRFSINRHDRA